MYYMLECFGFDYDCYQDIGNVPFLEGINWNLGRIFTQSPPEPIEISIDANTEGPFLPMYDCGILLFSDEMIAALRKAGVDNFNTYKTTLIDTKTKEHHTNYKAVNIIGLVAVADMSKSKYSDPSGNGLIDMDFDSLVIDEKKARGLLMFRLAECVSGIVIHDRVKYWLEKEGIKGLDFVDPQEWVG